MFLKYLSFFVINAKDISVFLLATLLKFLLTDLPPT